MGFFAKDIFYLNHGLRGTTDNYIDLWVIVQINGHLQLNDLPLANHPWLNKTEFAP
jgi:hypothetical protein